MKTRPKNPRGRPRSDEARQAIFRAAIALCSEAGFHTMTIEGVAARARVGKQTIYRWWPNLLSLLFDALTEVAGAQVAPLNEKEAAAMPPEEFVRRTFSVARAHRFALSKMMALAQLDEESRRQLLDRFIGPRRKIAHAVFFKNAGPRQEREWFLDLFFGTLWYGLLVREEILSPVSAQRLIEIYRSSGLA